jgi:hypothetical protein
MRQMHPVSRVPTTAAPAGGIELSEKKLAELIDAIEAAAAPHDDQCRAAARLPAQGTVLLAPVNPGSTEQPREVRVYDVSRFGVAVLDEEPIPTGTQINLLIPREGRRPLEMLCTVRHTRPLNGAHVIGAQFGASWLSTVATLVNPAATGHVTP